MQVEEAVTVGAQVPANVAKNDGRGLAVVMVVTHGLRCGKKMGSVLMFGPQNNQQVPS